MPTTTQNPTQAGQPSGLSVIAGSAFPTYAETHKALDELHIVCECATVPEVENWYRGDAFAKEARQRAIDVLFRHTCAESEREVLIGFREAVRRIAAKPIDSSDMMDEIEHLLSLPQNSSGENNGNLSTEKPLWKTNQLNPAGPSENLPKT